MGLGFAAFENTGYCITKGWSAVWERAITSVPFHALAGAIVGYAVGYSLTKRQPRWAFVGVAVTALLHGVNNFDLALLYDGSSSNGDHQLPTRGIEAILITGWPSMIGVVLMSLGLVLWLAFRCPFRARQTESAIGFAGCPVHEAPRL